MTQEQKIIRAKVGPAFDVRTGVRLTPRWREPDSNHGSREGVVGAFANFSGCRLFRLSGAEVRRRNAGRIRGFEEGE